MLLCQGTAGTANFVFLSEAMEPGRYAGVFRRQATCQDAKSWPERSARNRGTSAKLWLSCRTDPAKLSACLKNCSASASRLNRARVAVQRSMRGPTPNSANLAKTDL